MRENVLRLPKLGEKGGGGGGTDPMPPPPPPPKSVTAVRQFLGGSKIACSVVTVVPMTSALFATDYYTNGISRKDNSMSSYY